jgi:ParB family chromosome partitioning protein
MSKPKGGLGRGLAALIPTGPQTNVVSDVFMGETSAPHDASAASGSTPEQPGSDRDNQSTHDTAPGESITGPSSSTADGVTQTQTATATRPSALPGGPRYEELPISQLRPNPRNPRTIFDEDALTELEHSLREFGLLQPIVVREVSGGYELVMGERRWRAAQRAGLTTIPAIIRKTEDADLLRDALLENIHRANLNPLEEAAAYQQLLQEFDVTQEELASRIGRSRPVISNTIRLLKLPVPVQRRVAAGVLSAGHARALLSLEDPGEQEELATRVVAEGLSVRGTEEAVVLMAGRTGKPRRATPKKLVMPGLAKLAVALSDTFDTRVRVELGRQKGRVIVEFATVDDLERIVAIMAPEALEKRRNESAEQE